MDGMTTEGRGQRLVRPILERDAELAALAEALDEASAGRGRLLLVAGAAGIGKTALLRAGRERARATGVQALAARGTTLERDFAFGVVRQLLEPPLAAADPSERSALLDGAASLAEPVFGAPAEPRAPDLSHGVLHGLYWLAANLAERGPMALIVDDAQWADVASLRFLHYLTTRLDGLPIAVFAATRTGEPAADSELLRAFTIEATPPVLRPAALSEGAVAELVRTTLGAPADDALVTAFHRASNGNPFLVTELLAEIRSERRSVGELSADMISRLAPARIKASVAMRVGRLSPNATSVARTIAVLGDDASAELVADLAGLAPAEVHSQAATLGEAEILEPGSLRVVHPLVRTALVEDMSAEDRDGLHVRAARLLQDRAAEPEAVAVHLLATAPIGAPATVDALAAAAGVALSRGAPESAIGYLRRALAEPPEPDRLAVVTRELGIAEALASDPAGIDRLWDAFRLVPPGDQRAELALIIGKALMPQGRVSEGVAAFDRGLEEARNRDLALILEVEACTGARLLGAQRASLVARLDGLSASPPVERMVQAGAAWELAFSPGSTAEMARLARRALGDGLVDEQGPLSGPVWDSVSALLAAEEPDPAERFIRQALGSARAGGTLMGVGVAQTFLALAHLHRGAPGAAASDAQTALDVARAAGASPGITLVATASLAHGLLDRGQPDQAWQALEHAFASLPGGADLPPTLFVDHLLFARARLLVARGRLGDAATDLRLLDGRARRYLPREPREEPGGRSPYIPSVPYRELLASVLAGLGEREEAVQIATSTVELARACDRPGALGIAYHAYGIATGGTEGIEALGRAVEYLERSQRRVDHARALIDLGSALRRAGKRTDARTRLAAGMDLAHHCGSLALAEQAHAELAAVGARPRRFALTGRDALTPSELRAAEMAAEGMTNKEIAQSLFVTLRTVEMHLSSAYGKLEISSRRELPRALRR